MILQVILTLSFAAVVLGEGCCTPKQWEGYEMAAGGYTTWWGRRAAIRSGFRISYDANNERVAVSGFERRKERKFKNIYNFRDGVGYVIFPDTKKCKQFELKREFHEACIPADARKLGNTFLGAGDNTLEVTAYGLARNGSRYSVAGVAEVTTTGCIPVSEDWWGSVRRTGFFTNVNFAGITAGIEDPTVFNPPEYCEQVYMEELPREFTEFHVLRVSTQEMDLKN